MDTGRSEAKPEEVDHWTLESHWCGDCWSCVVDCDHVVDPLPFPNHAVNDVWIGSLAYDRATQCLEVRFTWNTVTQFRPVPLQIVREIWKARPMNVALETPL